VEAIRGLLSKPRAGSPRPQTREPKDGTCAVCGSTLYGPCALSSRRTFERNNIDGLLAPAAGPLRATNAPR